MSIEDDLERYSQIGTKNHAKVMERIRSLEAENAKLRELVSVVYEYYAIGTISPCDICDSIGCQYVGETESGCRYRDYFYRAEAADNEIQKRMRELGIEVKE